VEMLSDLAKKVQWFFYISQTDQRMTVKGACSSGFFFSDIYSQFATLNIYSVANFNRGYMKMWK
jgi:hypothetical protein